MVRKPNRCNGFVHKHQRKLSILGDVYLNYEFFDGLDYRFSLGLNSSYTNFKVIMKLGKSECPPLFFGTQR
ncbi:MAG: hypothetical protein CM15mP32_4960 [Flavobacteriaceae bacterium]|nr:MAG: hypothetical protein CM15mP32_4960 [Flavobacteriaceae bacterium]